MLDGPSDTVTTTAQANAARTGYVARTNVPFLSTSASGGRSAARDEGRDEYKCPAREYRYCLRGAVSKAQENGYEDAGGVHILTCSGLTSAYGFCVPTLSRDAKDAARDVPQGPQKHTRTAGAAARRRQRAHAARVRPQIGALARVQRVQGEREERPDVSVQVRPRSARRVAVARVWICRRVEGGRKAERVNRAAAYAWLARSVSTVLARKRDDTPQGGQAPR
jgi:hypothetical protein